jgi:uncharacterized repeat protein (TIGR01451 family)
METPVLIPDGTGTVNNADGREGDLSGINLDPSDSSFWASEEFATPGTFGNSWGEAVADFNVGPTVTADLALSESGPSSANEGDNNLTYSFTVTNGGPSDAPSTVLTDTLGANLKFVSATISQGSFTQSGSTVTFNFGTVTNGHSATATVTAQATEDGSGSATTDSGSVTSSATDPTPGDNSQHVTTTVAEPSISPIPSITTTASTFSGPTGTFTHASGVEPASAFTATINWGDGRTSTGTITLSGTTYTVSGSHRYKHAVTHTITTSVVESGAAPNGVSSGSSVGGAALLATSQGLTGANTESANLAVLFAPVRPVPQDTFLLASLEGQPSGAPAAVPGGNGSDSSIMQTGVSASILTNHFGSGSPNPDFRTSIAGAGEQAGSEEELDYVYWSDSLAGSEP